MKIYSFFALGALLLLTLTAAAPRTVKAPEFESGQLNFRIAAVHLSDTATRIDADIYARPGKWEVADTSIRLISQVTDNEYPVIRIEEVEFESKVFGEGKNQITVPGYVCDDSAHIRATFVFERLAPSDSIFDFIGKFGIWNTRGINLNYRPNGIQTHLTGVINGRPDASWIALLPFGKDARVAKPILIPVNNGKFEYDLCTPDTVPYEIMVVIERLATGSWYNHHFIAEGDTVKFDFSDEDSFSWNNTTGGPGTQKLLGHYSNRQDILDGSGVLKEQKSLMDSKQFYSEKAYEIFAKLNDQNTPPEERDALRINLEKLHETSDDLSPAAKVLVAKMDSVNALIKKERTKLMEEDASIVGLSLIYDDMVSDGTNLDEALDIFKRVYATRYQNNPLGIEIIQYVSNEKAEVGANYPDFTAPDLQGNMHTLSDLIKGKYAIIDLWASWCSSCRKHSVELIPIYNKWKDKGFTVVGIARESQDTKAMEFSIKSDGYPWLNLVELNDAGNIWLKYGANNAGGKILFVAPDGKILALEPKAAEVDALLTKLIGDK